MDDNLDFLKFLSNCDNYYLTINPTLEAQKTGQLDMSQLCLYRIEEPAASDITQRLANQEDFLNCLKLQGLLFVFLEESLQRTIRYYYGIAPNLNELREDIDYNEYINQSGEILVAGFEAMFPEGNITKVPQDEVDALAGRMHAMECASILEGCVGNADANNSCINKINQIMGNDDFIVLVLARPIGFPVISKLEKRFQDGMMELSRINGCFRTQEVNETCSNNLVTTVTNLLSDSRNNTCSRQYQFDLLDDLLSNSNDNSTLLEDIAQSINLENDEETPAEPQTGVRDIVPPISTQPPRNGEIQYKNINNTQTFSELKIKLNSLTNAVSKNNTNTRVCRTVTTQAIVNLTATSWYNYGNTVLVPRFDYAKGFGMFLYTTLLLTNTSQSERKLEVIMKRVYNNTNDNKVPVKSFQILKSDMHYEAFMNFQILKYKNSLPQEARFRTFFSEIAEQSTIYAGNFITSNILSKITMLP